MKLKDILKSKVTFAVALLILVTAAILAEQVFLRAIAEDNEATDNAVSALLAPNSQRPTSLSVQISGEKVALAYADIPLIPGAERMTFDNANSVKYRVNDRATRVANFYREVMTGQGWRMPGQALTNKKLEKVTITYSENPISKKTDVIYTYKPSLAVLGVKIAEADVTAPAPAPEPTPAPAPAPVPESTSTPSPAPEPQPQPMPTQPTGDRPADQPTDQSGQPMPPFQPGDQPRPNQMEFIRPMQPNGDYQNREGGQEMNQRQNFQGREMMGQERQGPSEEEMKKMDERRFNDMKRGLSQFSNGAKMMKKMLPKIKASINKCGVNLPEELTNALDQTDNLIGKINSAKNAEELDEVMNDIQDVGSVMQEWGPRMGDLTRLCQMLKQADRDSKRLDRDVKRIEAQVKANKKVDLSELAAEYKTAVAALKEALAKAKELAKTDPDEALNKLEEDFYGNMDNLGNLQMQIDAVVNINKGLRSIGSEINGFTSKIKALAKKKVDITEMQEMLNNLKTQVAEIKSLIKTKFDAEDLVAKVEEAFDSRQELQDALQEYDMIITLPKVNSGSSFNVKMNLPDAFKKTEKAEDSADEANGQN